MPKESVTGPVKSLLTEEESADRRLALAKYEEFSDSEDFARERLLESLSLTRGLAEFLEQFPLGDPEKDPVQQVLNEQVDRVRTDAEMLLEARQDLNKVMDELDKAHPDWARRQTS